MGRRTRSTVLVLVLIAFPVLGAIASLPTSASSPVMTLDDIRQTGKVHPDLYRIERGDAPMTMTDGTAQSAPPVRDGFVTVAAVPSGGGPALLADLNELGLQDGVAITKLVTGRLPIDQIDAAGELDSLRFIRPEWTIHSLGPVTSQGDAMLKTDTVRANLKDPNDPNLPIDGKGVTVGTLSDSFNCDGGAANDAAELPSGGVEILNGGEGPCTDPVPPSHDPRRTAGPDLCTDPHRR